MRPGWKWAAAMSVLALGVLVSVSGAATSGSKRDGGAGDGRSRGEALRAPLAPPGHHLATLADELGVSEQKLQDALEAVRDDVERGERPDRDGPPTRAEMEKRCNQFTDALAKELNKSGDDVRAAIKSAAKKDIEQAVEDKRLTRSQADRILSRLDDAACLPAFGFHRHGGPGCGPGGERFERHDGRPGRRAMPAPRPGSRGTSTVVPAPWGAPA
jgi:hypothetical protein